MRVELDPSLFSAEGVHDLEILGIFALCLHGRHRAILEDLSFLHDWGPTRVPGLRDEVFFALEEGERHEAEAPRQATIRVAPISTPIWGESPTLPPREALSLLARPLRVLLENGRNDAAFLLAFASASNRRRLDEASRSGWLLFETGGGIQESAARLVSMEGNPGEILRVIALTDSDARTPEAISKEAATVQKTLDRLEALHGLRRGFLGHVLRRRAAENYAPPKEVVTWATPPGREAHRIFEDMKSPERRTFYVRNPPKPGTWVHTLLAALVLTEMDAEVRNHLDFKNGRGTTSVRVDEGLWKKLDPFQQTIWRHGLGAGFSASFFGSRQELQDQSGEITAFIELILERC